MIENYDTNPHNLSSSDATVVLLHWHWSHPMYKLSSMVPSARPCIQTERINYYLYTCNLVEGRQHKEELLHLLNPNEPVAIIKEM